MKRLAQVLSTVTLSLFAVLLAVAAPAHASKGVVDQFGSQGTAGGQFTRAEDIAVDSATGDVFVADWGNNRVQRFDADGNFERAWGWDVDADDPGTGFEICVAPSTCKAGVQGPEPGQVRPRGIAVDPVNDAVYVGSANQTRVQRFDRDGNFVAASSFPVQSQLNGGMAVAIRLGSGPNTLLVGDGSPASGGGLGRIYWTDLSLNVLLDFQPGKDSYRLGPDSAGNIYLSPLQNAQGSEPVLKVGPYGADPGVFAPAVLSGHGPMALEADPVNDRIYVSRWDRPVDSSQPHNALREIVELDPDGNLIDRHATGLDGEPGGLAVNTSTGTLYAASEDEVLIVDDLTNPPLPVIASIDPSSHGATLEGTVNPQGTGYSTGYHWEYRKQGTQDWTSSPTSDVMVGNGTDPEPAGPEAISGLAPNTTYEVRLIATRKGGAGFALDTDSFKTDALAPSVTERSAYPVGDTTAQLRAVANPNNTATEYHFEYGTDDGYGNTTPVRSVGAVYEDVPLYATVQGLQPGTTYHFRLVADNGAGDPVEGPDVTFTTRTTAEMAWPARGVELANPPETGSQNVAGLLSRESDHVFWATAAGAPGSPTGSLGAFVAERTLNTPQGWESRSMLPPIDQLVGGGQVIYKAMAVSSDARSFGFQVPYESSNYWVRGNPDGTQTVLAQTEGSEGAKSARPMANPDITHFLILDETRLAGTAHPNKTSQVYDVGSGTPRLVSRLPGGIGPTCGVVDTLTTLQGSGFGETAYEGFSRATGPGVPFRVFFETNGNGCSTADISGAFRRLYVNDDKGTADTADDESTLISGPPVSGPTEKAYFLRANVAGDQAVYATATRLVAEDTDSTADLYMWTLGEGNECLTCGFAAPADIHYGNGTREVIVASDLSAMFFRSPNQLLPGEGIEGSEDNLWRLEVTESGPELVYVGQGGSDPKESEASEDGEILVFKSDVKGVTPDRTGGFAQFYRYDSTDGTIECISCPPPGVPGQQVDGAVTQGSIAGVGIEWVAKRTLLSADGSTFVFSSPVAYLPEDINGGTDVYEWRRDGRLRLVSDGETRFPVGVGAPRVSGISADGRNILFTVAAKLTGFEIDGTSQLFIARVGGGFPPPDPAAEPCVEDACQGPLVAAPGLESFGSKEVRGAGNARVQGSQPRARCTRKQVRRGKRCVAKRATGKRTCKQVKAKKGKGKQRCAKSRRRAAASNEGSSK